MQEDEKQVAEQSLIGLTAEIAAAYVSNNSVSTGEIGRLIADIGRELRALGGPQEPEDEKPEPAVSVRRSVANDHLICLVCGKKQKMLKRHLMTEHELTPDEYRRLYDLKLDYPMVAPSYAKTRRELALKIGLGHSKAANSRAATTKKAPAAPKTRRPRGKAA